MSKIRRQTSLQVALLGCVLLLAATPTLAAPDLIPRPREINTGEHVALAHGISVRTAGTDADDKFAAKELVGSLADREVKSVPAGFPIVLLRSQSPQPATLLPQEKPPSHAPTPH